MMLGLYLFNFSPLYATVTHLKKALCQFFRIILKIIRLPGPLWFMSPWAGSTRTEQAAPVHHWVRAFNSRRHFECGTPRGATGPPSWNYFLHFLSLFLHRFLFFLIYHLELVKDIIKIISENIGLFWDKRVENVVWGKRDWACCCLLYYRPAERLKRNHQRERGGGGLHVYAHCITTVLDVPAKRVSHEIRLILFAILSALTKVPRQCFSGISFVGWFASSRKSVIKKSLDIVNRTVFWVWMLE